MYLCFESLPYFNIGLSWKSSSMSQISTLPFLPSNVATSNPSSTTSTTLQGTTDPCLITLSSDPWITPENSMILLIFSVILKEYENLQKAIKTTKFNLNFKVQAFFLIAKSSLDTHKLAGFMLLMFYTLQILR